MTQRSSFAGSPAIFGRLRWLRTCAQFLRRLRPTQPTASESFDSSVRNQDSWRWWYRVLLVLQEIRPLFSKFIWVFDFPWISPPVLVVISQLSTCFRIHVDLGNAFFALQVQDTFRFEWERRDTNVGSKACFESRWSIWYFRIEICRPLDTCIVLRDRRYFFVLLWWR